MAVLLVLEKMFEELQEKRRSNGGLVQGCQHVSEDLRKKLESAGIAAKRCLIKSPCGPFENNQTGDYIHYHFFLSSGEEVFDPFVSPQPINLREYLGFYDGDNLHVGTPNPDGSYEFIPIRIF